MTEQQLAILIDNMAKALAARLEILEKSHPELMRDQPPDVIYKIGATMMGNEIPDTVKVQPPAVMMLWALVSDWQADAELLRKDVHDTQLDSTPNSGATITYEAKR